MKNVTLTLVIVLLSITGCTAIYDLWPAQIPKDTESYSGIEPNSIGWAGIGKLKNLREICITKNIITQSDLAQKMNLDKALYTRAIEQANINITNAELERNQIVGTLNNPGWLLSLLLPAAGVFTGRAVTKLTHYSETELQNKIKEVTKNNTT